MPNKTCSRCKRTLPLSAFARHKRHTDGLACHCRDCTREYRTANRARNRASAARWEKANPDKIRARKQRYVRNHPFANRDYRRRKRLQVLNHYGAQCAWCGETRYELLQIDHIAGDGWIDRSSGNKLVNRIIREGFPAGFQVLCASCNGCKGVLETIKRKQPTQWRAFLEQVETGTARHWGDYATIAALNG